MPRPGFDERLARWRLYRAEQSLLLVFGGRSWVRIRSAIRAAADVRAFERARRDHPSNWRP